MLKDYKDLKEKVDLLVNKYYVEEHKELFNFENNNINNFEDIESYVIERINILLNVHNQFVQLDVFAGTYGSNSLPANFKSLQRIYNITKNILNKK